MLLSRHFCKPIILCPQKLDRLNRRILESLPSLVLASLSGLGSVKAVERLTLSDMTRLVVVPLEV
jgi:hypothetical protein